MGSYRLSDLRAVRKQGSSHLQIEHSRRRSASTDTQRQKCASFKERCPVCSRMGMKESERSEGWNQRGTVGKGALTLSEVEATEGLTVGVTRCDLHLNRPLAKRFLALFVPWTPFAVWGSRRTAFQSSVLECKQ